MSSGFEDLPDDIDFEELISPKKKDKKKTYQIPGTTRHKTVDTSIRTYVNWFKMPLTMMGECQVPTHDEERSPRQKMVVEIDDVFVYRRCFIEGRDLDLPRTSE